MLYGAVGRVGLRASAAPFSPSQLFSAGEIGAWYDPSDLSTMFQDSAGTTPVTAVGQAVGLILDKSQGLTLGSEAIPQPINLNSGWAVNGPGSIASSVTFTASSTAGVWINAMTVGKWYRITGNVSTTAGTLSLVNAPSGNTPLISSITSGQNFSLIYYAVDTELYVRLSTSVSTTVTINNISVKELLGNHASQSTPTARPLLSARVNLLTYSEQFDNAAWVAGPAGTGTVTKSTTNAATAPDGTTTADRVIFSLNGGTATTDIALLRQSNATTGSLTFSIWARSLDGTSSYTMQIIKPDGTAQSITVTGDWQKFTVSGTSSASVNYGIRLRGGQTPANSNSADVLLWGADLRTSNQPASLPTYQRIAAATDYDTTGFPYYLSFDGTDDFLVTGTINPGSVDKSQVFAGVRKTTDTGIPFELSASGTNVGIVSIYAGDQTTATGPYWTFTSKGTNPRAAQSPASYSAPVTNVLTGLGNISGDTSTLRINGAQAATNTGDQGTGNYGSYPLYIGRRGGTSLPFNGNVYSLVVRFSAANLSDSVISQTETWVNTKTGAY